jgi:hypothetical protein
MFKWIKERRKIAKDAEVRSAALCQDEVKGLEEAAIKELQERSKELQALLIEAGIHPVKHANRNVGLEWISMYGILNGELVHAKMFRPGGLALSYVKRGKR